MATNDNLLPEFRASVYRKIIEQYLDYLDSVSPPSAPPDIPSYSTLSDIKKELHDIPNEDDRVVHLVHELCIQQDAETHWKNLLYAMAPSCRRSSNGLPTENLLQDVLDTLKLKAVCEDYTDNSPPDSDLSLKSIALKLDACTLETGHGHHSHGNDGSQPTPTVEGVKAKPKQANKKPGNSQE
jgi:hypothetical protein